MKTIKILGYDYTVSYSPAPKDGGMLEDGRCTVSSQSINVDPDQCEQAQVSTILHEIIEALNYHLQLNLEHNKIVLLETGLFQVMNDNGVNISELKNGLRQFHKDVTLPPPDKDLMYYK